MIIIEFALLKLRKQSGTQNPIYGNENVLFEKMTLYFNQTWLEKTIEITLKGHK